MASDRDGKVERGFRVLGRVQGVGFRWWVRSRAMELGLTGWVRNLRDGSVAVHARGSAEQVRKLEEALRGGPSLARVDRVELVDPAIRPDLDDFVIER